MIKEEDILSLIKKAYDSKMPDWFVKKTDQVRNNLEVHTKGMLFSKVDTLFPHEHPDSKAYCINTYEPITKGSVWKAINNSKRVFSNSSINVTASESTIKAIGGAVYDGSSLFTYFINQWNDNVMASDPNCLIVVYPLEYTKEQVKFIKANRLKHISKDLIVFVSEEESEKSYEIKDFIYKKEVFYDPEVNGPNARTSVEKTYNQKIECKFTKEMYHLFTKTEFIKFATSDGKTFEYEIFDFGNEFATIPAYEATSPLSDLNIKDSFLQPFIPFGNLALLQHRNHRAVDLMFSYPRISEIETPCEVCNGGNEECKTCHGTGYTTVQSPYKIYKKKLETGLADSEVVKAMISTPPVEFHTPEVGILNYSKDSWKEYLSMAEEAVFVQQKQKTGNIESYKSKEIDKESEYTWVLGIRKGLNTDLSKAIQALENYLNPNPAIVSVDQPVSFALVTESEAFKDLDIIVNSDAPVFVKEQKVDSYLGRFVSKSSFVVKAIDVLKAVDLLLFYNNKEIASLKSTGAITLDAVSIHVYAYPVLQRMYAEDSKLFDSDIKILVERIKSEIKKIAPTSKTIKESLLEVV